MMAPTDPDSAVSGIRKESNSRQFALRTYHPDVGRVDSETFWLIWRDGANAALKRSGNLNELFRSVAPEIMLMGQADEAAPPMLIAAAVQMVRNALDMPDQQYDAVLRSDLARLRQELEYHGHLKGPEDGS
jgi:hypothetical protein